MKKTGLLWLVVALVVGYAYVYEYKGQKDKASQEQEAKKLFKADLKDIVSIQLKTNRGIILIEKKSDVWTVVQPFEDVADIGAIQNLINTLTNESYEEVVAEGDFDTTIYGLQDPFWIEVKTTNASQKLSIGTVTGMSGKKYLQRDADKQVLLGSFTWDTVLNKESNEFRKKDLFGITEAEIQKIQFKNTKLNILREGNLWKIEGFKTDDLDSSALDGFVTSLLTLRASQVDEAKASSKKVAHDIEVQLSNNTTLNAKIFEADGNTSRIEVSGRSVAFKISSAVAQTFNKKMDDFRDRKKPFNFDRNQVTEIEFLADPDQFHVKKESGTWGDATGNKRNVDSAEVERFLNKLSQLRVKSYLGKDIPFQESGSLRLKLKSQTQDLLTLEWSPRAIQDMLVTKSSIFEEYVGVLSQDIKDLPVRSIYKVEQNTSSK